MPRVIHILRKFEPAEWGGIETHLLGLLPELERLGWTSEVHAPAEAGTDGTPLAECGIEFRTFRACYPVLGMGKEGRARLVASGGNLITVDELMRLLRDRRASVFHVHTQGRLSGVVRLASRLKGVPFAVTIHGPYRSGAKSVRAAHADRTRGLIDLGAPFGLLVGARRVVHDADMVFVVNQHEYEAWRAAREGRHLEYVPHGVSLERASAETRAEVRQRIRGLGQAPFLVVVGRLDRAKGQDLAISAFRRAAPSGWHLVLAGAPTDAPFARELEVRAKTLAPRVHLLGGVSPAVARALLVEASLVLIPSRNEPFGIVLLEAWAEGSAALYSDLGGLAEVSRRVASTFGRVAEPREDAWVEKIRSVLADPASVEAERRAAPERVAEHFSWRAAARRIADAYGRFS